MRLVKNKEVLIDRWEELLASSPFASPFQTNEFLVFFNSLDHYKCDVFAIEDGGEYKALVIVSIQSELGLKSFFSRRGIIYGGPLSVLEGQIYLFNLFKGVNLFYRRKLIYLEVRNSFDYSNYNHLFKNVGYSYLPYLNFKISLTTEEHVLKNFKSEKRRQIKKSFNQGLTFDVAKNKEQVIELYKILKNIYENRAKKPLPNREYFMQLFSSFQRNNSGYIIVLLFEDKVIGGAICPIRSGVIYDWYRGGDDQKYKKLYPSTVAAYAGMKLGLDLKLTEYDFMGAGLKNKPYSVRNFKSQFGGTLVEHGRYIRIFNPVLYNIGRIGIYVLSKLKV
jgi:lipid II:glycine glycyltransferase (peptidoglycan interpeptide bridge formation enzyme)